MLEHFSWSDYWTTVGTATALYYVAAGTVLYRDKITALLTGAKKSPAPSPVPPTPSGSLMGRTVEDSPEADEPAADTNPEDTDDDKASGSENIQLLDRTENVGNRISRKLTELGPQSTRDKIIRELASIVSQYNTDGTLTPLRDAIDWHICQTSLDSTGIVLDEADLDAIWEGHTAI